jgi:hypothetical protein
MVSISLGFLLGISSGCVINAADQAQPQNVSLVQLLASPNNYQGKYVSVAGFLDEYGYQLFLTKDHRLIEDSSSAVFVGIKYKEGERQEATEMATGCENEYVRISGRFASIGYGYYAVYDVFRIAKSKNKPGPGPTWLGCWENSAADPAAVNARN